MGQWKVEYYFGTEWLEKSDATFDQVVEALDGHEEVTFMIPNTSDNRSFVQIN